MELRHEERCGHLFPGNVANEEKRLSVSRLSLDDITVISAYRAWRIVARAGSVMGLGLVPLTGPVSF